MQIELTINGKRRYVRGRKTVFEACREAGVYIPHFCYHPRLSIAANCRMCLVQIDKIPKPMPACATYVAEGMVISTESPMAKAAQKGVMEFLLINHPLDCPICDQGGECQLQDLAVGYGASETGYGETKRVVVEKRLGPLINTVMTRCIHCTRCVRYGQEVAGVMELGMVGRGEHAEIMPFIESTVDSEVSGNMIDICPVGALNSRPYRFSARTWEMRRAEAVAQHDSWGSYITVQTKDELVKRALPHDRDSINECWISDRDRFAYTGMNVPARLLEPQIRDAGASRPRRVEWPAALDAAAAIVKAAIDTGGPGRVGLLLGPNSSSEEALLAGKLMRALDSGNVDYRLYKRDFRADAGAAGIPWLGSSIEELSARDAVVLVGANPAHELPLLPVRLRRHVAAGSMEVYSVGARSLQNQQPMAAELIVKPSRLLAELGLLCKAAAAAGKAKTPAWLKQLGEPQQPHKELVARLAAHERPTILLGAQAQHAGDYAALRQATALLAELLGCGHGVLPVGANPVGCALGGALPHRSRMLNQTGVVGLNAAQMVAEGLDAYILLGCEPLDFIDAAAASASFASAKVIAIGAYADAARGYADVLLPAAQFVERKGAFVNLEGNTELAGPAVMPPGDSRPAWKILRVLGNLLELDGFDYSDIDQVRTELVINGDFSSKLDNELSVEIEVPEIAADDGQQTARFERILEIAHYSCDPLVRRAQPLQDTAIARRSQALRMHPDDLAQIGIESGAAVVAAGDGRQVECTVLADELLARGCVRAACGVERFLPLGAATRLTVEPAAASGQADGADGAAAEARAA